MLAKRDLTPGTRLVAGDLELHDIPRGAAHPLSVRELAEAVGFVLIAPVRQGEAILLADLAQPGPGGPLAVQLRPDERAVFVPWPQAGAHALEPGDLIDLIAVPDRHDGELLPETVAHARVLQLRPDDFSGGGFVAAVSAAAAGEVIAALARGTVHPVLRPLTEP